MAQHTLSIIGPFKCQKTREFLHLGQMHTYVLPSNLILSQQAFDHTTMPPGISGVPFLSKWLNTIYLCYIKKTLPRSMHLECIWQLLIVNCHVIVLLCLKSSNYDQSYWAVIILTIQIYSLLWDGGKYFLCNQEGYINLWKDGGC